MPNQVIDLTDLPASDGFILIGNLGYDDAGASVSNAGDVNGDGIDDFIVGAPQNDVGGTNAGAAYVIYGRTGPRAAIDLSNLSPSDGFAIVGDAARDLAGSSVSGAGDVNNDGLADIVIGAPRGDDVGTDAGEAYVIYGQSGSSRSTVDLSTLIASEGFIIQGTNAGYLTGSSVSDAGDVNGDGIDDIIIGVPRGIIGGSITGHAYVIYGQSGSTRTTVDLDALAASEGFLIFGDRMSSNSGASVSGAGDVNGDGIGDLIIGARSRTDLDSGVASAQAYIVYGQSGSTRSAVNLATFSMSEGFSIRGEGGFSSYGSTVSAAGDVNGDGIDDLIVGSGENDDVASNSGAAYVIYGQNGATRGIIDPAALLASDGFAILGTAAGDGVGGSISNAGDFNGDGIDDIIVGASGSDGGGINSGDAFLIYGRTGSARGTIDLGNFSANDGIRISGDAAYDQAGMSVSAAGDVNGDGFDDVLIGAPSSDGGEVDAGTAYIVFGFSAINGTDASETLTGTAGAETINGFGGNDLLDGGAGADTMRGGAGNDIYIVNDAGDTVEELVGEGTDRVETVLAAYTLTANVEILEYTGAGAFTGTGNGSANSIIGGGMGDTLSGLGGDDTLAGEAGNDVLNGGEGSDRLFGGAGGDIMNGEGGNDRMTIDDGADLAFGGDGIDTVQFVAAAITYTIANDVEIVSNLSGGALTVTLNALGNTYGGSAAGVDIVDAGDGQDSVYGRAGNDVLRGQGGNDYLFGQEGSDQLVGGDGADQLYGGADLDILFGDAGNDTLYGEAGTDFLAGGAGVDQLFGGAGTDFFVFFAGDSGATLATADRIRDYVQAQGDRIQLDGIDAVTGGADDAFSFIGSAAFSNVAGQLRVEVVGGETRVSGDINGDGVADFLIRIDGGHALAAGDFVL